MVSNLSNLLLLTSILFLPISLVDAVSKPSTCLVTERYALLEFKVIVNDPGGLLSSWTGRDCCRWSGIICDNATNHVIALNLSGADSMGLEGEIGASLASLAHLQILDLSSNDFNRTTIPNFLGSMKELQHLNLSSSNLSGDVPSQLSNLSNLHSLDLSNNFALTLIDPLWLDHLLSLRYLDLSEVDLQSMPDGSLGSLFNLPFISTIILRSCSISSPPRLIRSSNLSSLHFLDLSANPFSNSTRIPNWLANLTNVRHLYLNGNNFHGVIPDSLGTLTSLQELDLSGNSLTGSIPSTFAMLASLKKLDLTFNTLSGRIPEQLFSLRYLEKLDLTKNHDLSGIIPEALGQLKFLKKLGLEGNGLTGVISETHFLNLTLLEDLTITSSKSLAVRLSSNWMPPFSLNILAIIGCNMGPGFPMWVRTQHMLAIMSLVEVGISGSIPSWIWNFSPVLQNLYLQRNNFTGVLPNMTDVSPLLSDVGLGLNQLEGPITISLDLTPSLYSLNISGNKLEGNFQLKGGPCILTTLDLRKNNLSGEFPPSLRKCSQMYNLQLGWNNFNGSLPPWISQSFPKLDFLNLRSNHISGHLLNLSMSVLDLADNELSGTIPDGLLCNVVTLSLGGNNLSGGTGNDHPVRCSCSLTSLHLENNFLKGVIPSFIQTCTKMLILDLGNNRLEGSIPNWIPEKLPSLRFLSLRSNAFTGTIPLQLYSMKSLQILDLANNELHGVLPQHFGNLSAMKVTHWKNESYPHNSLGSYSESVVVFTRGVGLAYYDDNIVLVTSIDLSYNNLFGEIPNDVSDLLGLVNLNLSGNHLSGPIPDNISRLRGMQTLDLSMNNLSGEIPQSMSMMTWLSALNFSYNNFVGKIPVGGQFQTFSNKSFMGNLGLCGFPLGSCKHKDGNIGGSDDRLSTENTYRHMKLSIYVSVVLGFIIGFWSVCGPILFKARWRYAYFRFVDNMADTTYVAFALIVKPRARRLLNFARG